MKIPKGVDLRIDTANEMIELHMTATITTKAQANELAAAIKQFASVLEGETRRRKPKVVTTAQVA